MYASKSPLESKPDSYGKVLTTFAVTIAAVDLFLYVVSTMVLWWRPPSLAALAGFARDFAWHADGPDTDVVFSILRNGEVYLLSELQAAKEILLVAHDLYVYHLWETCLVGFLGWVAVLWLGQKIQEHLRFCRHPQRLVSKMGIAFQGAFVPCPMPMPALARVHLLPTRKEQWYIRCRLARPRPRPLWAAGLQPQTALALALVEHYLAYPGWPAEVVTDETGQRSSHHGDALLGEHVAAIRQRAMELAWTFGVPPVLAEQFALAHDLGKLVTFQRGENQQWDRVLRHHDRIGSQLLAALPEWQALAPEDREDLRRAVRFHHAPRESLPEDLSPRVWSLLALKAQAHKQTAWWEVDATVLSHLQGTAAPGTPGDASPGTDQGPSRPVVVVTAPRPAAAPVAPAAPAASAATPGSGPPGTTPSVPSGSATTPENGTPPSGSTPAGSTGRPAAPRTKRGMPLPLFPDPAGDRGGNGGNGPVAAADELPDPAPLPLVPVLPELATRLPEVLQSTLRSLTINSISMFSGQTLPGNELVMLLDQNLRHALCGPLTADECGLLRVSALEVHAGGGAKMPVPHPSAANLAAAFRRLGWLVELYGDQVGTLWKVEVGRRTWQACWLLKIAALPPDVVARWPGEPKFIAKPIQPSWIDPHHAARAVPDPLVAADDGDPLEDEGLLHGPLAPAAGPVPAQEARHAPSA